MSGAAQAADPPAAAPGAARVHAGDGRGRHDDGNQDFDGRWFVINRNADRECDQRAQGPSL
jgi:hypothetical protein